MPFLTERATVLPGTGRTLPAVFPVAADPDGGTGGTPRRAFHDHAHAGAAEGFGGHPRHRGALERLRAVGFQEGRRRGAFAGTLPSPEPLPAELLRLRILEKGQRKIAGEDRRKRCLKPVFLNSLLQK